MWGEITCPFPNFNSAAVEAWEQVNYINPHLVGMLLLIHAGIEVNPC